MTESCIQGAWKKLCPDLAVDFRGFDLSERLSKESHKCLKLARKVGFDEIEDKDVDSLLKSIGEELSMEELDELDQQWRQLEEEVEVEQYPMATLTKQLTMSILQRFFGMLNEALDYLDEVDHDYERAGLTRRRMLANAAHYEQLLHKKRREATQPILDSFFRRETSLPEASTSEDPHTSDEPPANDEPQTGTSTGGYTRPNVSSPSS